MEHQRTAWELHREVFLRIERIYHFTLIVVVLCIKSVSHISREEEMTAEIGSSESGQTHTIAINEIMRHYRIDRSDVKL